MNNKQYEYKIFNCNQSRFDVVIKWLNKLNVEQRWELLSVSGPKYYFKRVKL